MAKIFIIVQECEHEGDMQGALEVARRAGRIVNYSAYVEYSYETGCIELETTKTVAEVNKMLNENPDSEGFCHASLYAPDGW